MTGYTVTHIGRSTRQDGPDWTPKERAMDEDAVTPDGMKMVREQAAQALTPEQVRRFIEGAPARHKAFIERMMADEQISEVLAQAPVTATPKDKLASACLSYRHDFGLLEGRERETVLFEASEWLRAFEKAGFIAHADRADKIVKAQMRQIEEWEGHYRTAIAERDALAARVKALTNAAEIGKLYVEGWVKADGGIDSCDIDLRTDLEAITAALTGAASCAATCTAQTGPAAACVYREPLLRTAATEERG